MPNLCLCMFFFPCFGTKTVPFLERESCIRHGVTLVYTSSMCQALDTFSTMDYCSCLKIHMALVELIHVFSYLNLNQEMPDNKCLFSEKKKNVPWNLLIGFSFKSSIYMDTVKKWSSFLPEGSKFVWNSNFCSWRTLIHKICKNWDPENLILPCRVKF